MTRNIRRIIAALEVAGGAFGILTGLPFIARSEFSNSGNLFVACVILAVFALHIFAGVMLWSEPRRGLSLSIVAQALVLPRVISPVVSLYLVSALNATIGFEYWWQTSDPAFQAGAHGAGFWSAWLLGSNGQIRLGTGGPPEVAVGVNIVAIVLLVLLMKERNSNPNTPSTVPGDVVAPSV